MFRSMTDLEQKTALLLVEAGESSRWEYSASLECSTGPLLEFSTERLDYKANPSPSILAEILQWPNFVLHHNHLSGESLSLDDWRGASCLFKEIYAHCNDGTSYYGKVLDAEKVLSVIDNKESMEMNAENCLFNFTNNTKVDAFFRKEVICRALKIRGYVEYGNSWGTKRISHQAVLNINIWDVQSVGQLGIACESWVQAAAVELSNSNW